MKTEIAVNIRKGTKEDLPAILQLVHELAEFEKAPDAITNTLSMMEEEGFGKRPVFEFYVAEKDGEVIGMALFFVKYSTWKGAGLYLDDLIVREKYRGAGIGTKLFNTYLLEAKRMNAKQAHWQVLDWNTPAIDMYKKAGASVEAEWLDCKMNEEEIQAYLDKLN